RDERCGARLGAPPLLLEAGEVVAEEALPVFARQARGEALLGELGGELRRVRGELLPRLLQALCDLGPRRLLDAGGLALGLGEDLLALALPLALGAGGELVDLAPQLGDLRREPALHPRRLLTLAVGLGERVGERLLLVLEEAHQRRTGGVGEEAEEDDQVDRPVDLVGKAEEGAGAVAASAAFALAAGVLGCCGRRLAVRGRLLREHWRREERDEQRHEGEDDDRLPRPPRAQVLAGHR